jgi:hypothetical protein
VKQKQSLVDILLEQQKDPVVTVPVDESNNIVSGQHNDNQHVSTEEDFDCTVSFGDAPKSAPQSAVYEAPSIFPPKSPYEKSGGLRGSRPLVKLNRMSLITQMLKEGKDGDRMGDYAPDSQYSSIDLSSISGALKPVSETPENPAPQPELSRIRNLSSAYPTLSLKDLSLLNVIGGGGFGQVWKGTWGGTPVAVKLLNNLLLPQGAGPVPPEQEQLLNAFEEEVSMLAQLRHPNICLFLGVCLEPPHRAIVTELVSRGSLWDCLRIPNLFQVSVVQRQ